MRNSASQHFLPQRLALLVLAASQLLGMLILLVWNYRDPRLERLSLYNGLFASDPALSSAEQWALSGILWSAIFLGAVALSASLWAGGIFRSLKYLGLLMLVCALWLGLATHWKRVAWLGHRGRALSTINVMQPIATSLQQNWPKTDSEDSIFGPYMAYPNWNPRTLILLTPMAIGDGSHSLAAVDRGSQGKLRFELSDGLESLWLEWSPQIDTTETEFSNGIGETYFHERSIDLKGSWTLSRYR